MERERNGNTTTVGETIPLAALDGWNRTTWVVVNDVHCSVSSRLRLPALQSSLYLFLCLFFLYAWAQSLRRSFLSSGRLALLRLLMKTGPSRWTAGLGLLNSGWNSSMEGAEAEEASTKRAPKTGWQNHLVHLSIGNFSERETHSS